MFTKNNDIIIDKIDLKKVYNQDCAYSVYHDKINIRNGITYIYININVNDTSGYIPMLTSSMIRSGVFTSGSVVDAEYCGTICVPIINIGDTITTNKFIQFVPISVVKGDSEKGDRNEKELEWYLFKNNDVRDLGVSEDSIWFKIRNDDYSVNSFYGDIFKSQLDKIVNILKRDQYERRAVINYNVGKTYNTKDDICTLAQQFMIRDNKLHMTVIMRSNDLVFGLPNDIMWFLITQQIIADLLGIETGEYIHIANSLHYYTNLGDYYNKRLNDIITSNDKYENKDVCSHLIKYYSNKFLRAKERLKKENNE